MNREQMDHEHHRKHRCLQVPGEFELIEPILHDHSHPSLHLMRCHDREEQSLQILQQREMMHVHKERRRETFHSLGRVGEGRLWPRMVQLHNFHRHTAGIDSYTQHSMGWSSRDGHKGNCQLEAVGDGLVAEVGLLDFGRLLAAGPGKSG